MHVRVPQLFSLQGKVAVCIIHPQLANKVASRQSLAQGRCVYQGLYTKNLIRNGRHWDTPQINFELLYMKYQLLLASKRWHIV